MWLRDRMTGAALPRSRSTTEKGTDAAVGPKLTVQETAQSDRKYVFVCGLPRSGTSVLGRNIARMEDCTGLQNTGVLEDEGGFLQNVYPSEHVCGGPGRFGFDSRAHLTEHSTLLTPGNIAKLQASWHPYWDNTKTIFVEKTPANLLMTRFLQAAFSNSYFIVIKRHPIAVAMAAQKWKVNVTSIGNMFEHWLHCHALFQEDKKYLKHLYELTYEDYVQNPEKHHVEIAEFLGTRVPAPPQSDTFRYVVQWRKPCGLRVPDRTMEEVSEGYSQKYLDRWCHLLNASLFKGYYRFIAKKYESRFLSHGYSLLQGLDAAVKAAVDNSTVPHWIGNLYCIGADGVAFSVRMRARLVGAVMKRLRGLLPEAVKTRIRPLRRRLIPSRQKASVSC
jgi:hypothetical protein